MNTLNSGKPSSFKDTPRKRIARLFLIIVISIVAGTLVIQYATLPIRSHIEFQPLLERARTIMDGTADPAPSEELDGELYFWSWNRRCNAYPNASYVEVKPIEITAVQHAGDKAILTINFEITAYSKNGSIEMNASYLANKWYVRKSGDRWIVYKIESKPLINKEI